MDPHNLPTNTSNHSVPDMRAGDSLFGPFDSEPVDSDLSTPCNVITPDQPTESSDFTTPYNVITLTPAEDAFQEPVHLSTDIQTQDLFQEPASISTDVQTLDVLQEPVHLPTDVQTQDLSQEPASLPIDVQTLYEAYHASYAHLISDTSTHMQHAKALALALLQRHYPESQNYSIEPAALGPLSANGLNFRLKKSNEPDSDPDVPLAKQKRTTRVNRIHCSYEAPWHSIDPRNMAAFVVKHHAQALTFLLIILDDLATFPRWSHDNDLVRGDALSDLLGVIARVHHGHGMLLFGPRLELYQYNADDAQTPITPYPHPHWRMDMRTTSLAAVDAAMTIFAQEEVLYQDAS